MPLGPLPPWVLETVPGLPFPPIQHFFKDGMQDTVLERVHVLHGQRHLPPHKRPAGILFDFRNHAVIELFFRFRTFADFDGLAIIPQHILLGLGVLLVDHPPGPLLDCPMVRKGTFDDVVQDALDGTPLHLLQGGKEVPINPILGGFRSFLVHGVDDFPQGGLVNHRLQILVNGPLDALFIHPPFGFVFLQPNDLCTNTKDAIKLAPQCDCPPAWEFIRNPEGTFFQDGFASRFQPVGLPIIDVHGKRPGRNCHAPVDFIVRPRIGCPHVVPVLPQGFLPIMPTRKGFFRFMP